MEWLGRMNDAIDYLEAHLGERVDFEEAARIACCSLSRFQRMFALATDLSPAEYVRRRRMALAGQELLATPVRVADLAATFAYESPEAFTRVFQAFHGVSPTTARKLGVAAAFPRIVFRVTRNGGNLNMGTRPIVRIEEHHAEKVVSFFVNCQGPEQAAWEAMQQWAAANLPDCAARRYLGCAPKGHHPEGEDHQPDEEIGTHEYMAQMFLLEDEAGAPTFRGAEVVDAPKGLYLIGDVALNEYNEAGDIDIGTSMQTAYGVMAECLQEMGGYAFELGQRPYWEEHMFHPEWFTGERTGDRGLAGFRLWLPIGRVQG